MHRCGVVADDMHVASAEPLRMTSITYGVEPGCSDGVELGCGEGALDVLGELGADRLRRVTRRGCSQAS
jgi:hypothetical protein